MTLTGSTLSIEDVRAVAVGGESVQIDELAHRRMRESRAVIERMAASDQPIYGVNTGVGLFADVRIAADELEQLQRNIVRSHAVGVGPFLDGAVVRAMMLIRANVLATGCSGIRPVVADRLCELLNRAVTPLVPSRGSAGASGDLAPLSHMALVLIGEGQAEVDGVHMQGGEALSKAGIEPLTLQPKEGISLVNGTQAMLAIGCLALLDAEILAASADLICAMSLDALRGTPLAFDPRIHAARPHPGQVISAANLLRYLEGSEIRMSHISCRHVQDAYTLRCAPQVHGAVRDTIAAARRTFEIELNSSTDNPLVFGEEILSGGNFHGEPLALQLDYLAIALSVLSGISERRIDRLVNPMVNEGLPPFLTSHGGLESGFMMVQVTAAALVAENRVLAHPASPGSITTSGNKEDFVSMGMTAALKLQQVIENTRTVLAIEALAAARGIDCLRPLRSSPMIEAARERLREMSPEWTTDRALDSDIRRVGDLIASGAMAR